MLIDIENKSLSESISKSRSEVNVFNDLIKVENNKRVELERTHNQLYEELQKLQTEIRRRQKQKDEYLTKISEYQIAILEDTNTIKYHCSRIKELYNEELSESPVNIKNINIEKQKKDIEKMQQSIDNIGPINLAVNEEYAKETERYKFLIEQNTDLENSEKLIYETIGKLDDEANFKFLETFNSIQDNFKNTYSSFFDGGKGLLRLVDESDPLETEIEIIAQPPGKKPQALRMLSSGEKALTAIALLFAIYLVKPSPFCILDEVDAPLDDNNIGKFTQALKDFSNKTQFIVVTHNKLTMEKADYMYGITQEEEGISKIVSVKFQKGEIKKAIS
jgi:chromosome segregation protein